MIRHVATSALICRQVAVSRVSIDSAASADVQVLSYRRVLTAAPSVASAAEIVQQQQQQLVGMMSQSYCHTHARCRRTEIAAAETLVLH